MKTCDNILLSRQQFDKQAAQYNQRWASWSDETLLEMLTLAGPQPGWKVLDVATGTGFTALAFAPLTSQVIGVDISDGMLAQAAKRAIDSQLSNVEWIKANAESLPFPDSIFDLVTVRIAPHHFRDIKAFLSETERVLRPGGIFVLGDTTVPDDDLEAGEWQNAVELARDPSHYRNLSAGEWKSECEAAGLQVTHADNRQGAITIRLGDWLETAGCDEVRAERVRQMFKTAPQSAQSQFRIAENEDGSGIYFSWQRALIRAVRAAA